MADLGSIGRAIMEDLPPFVGGAISGTVTDGAGLPAVRTIIILNRPTRTVEAVLTTKADGTYVRNFPPVQTQPERIVICLDDDTAPVENDRIHRTFPA